jgi:GT2 family glycosyltransferase
MNKSSVAVIVLNWNDADLLPKSVGSLLKQSVKCDVIVVDNASTDDSRKVIESFGNKVTTLWNTKNKGFAGGVNTGIRYALQEKYEYIALLNNDAVADKDWVKHLVDVLKSSQDLGSVTCSLLNKDGKKYDSTGDYYTTWGLPYPRGRGESVTGQFDDDLDIMAASGGASMFKAGFFKDVGLYDEDFFAYYEDVDLGLRGQLKGWKSRFVPKAKVFHATGSTSSRVKGFTTYQTLKNLPWIIIKNVPLSLLFTIIPRFILAYSGFIVSAIQRKQLKYALKGMLVGIIYTPKKMWQRLNIQGSKKISADDFSKLLVRDLPPNAHKLRALRTRYWCLVGKNKSNNYSELLGISKPSPEDPVKRIRKIRDNWR